MLTNHVFVDFENVQDINLNLIGGKDVNFTLLIGPKQTRLDSELVELLLDASATVQLVRLTSPGKNALDFALSYYAGRASASDPHGYIHVVSKDRGFDPLIDHLKSKGVKARRHDDFTTLTFSAPAPAPAKKIPETTEALAKAKEYFAKNSNRPKKKTTLISHLSNHFAKKLTEQEVLRLVEQLVSTGVIAIDSKGLVKY